MYSVNSTFTNFLSKLNKCQFVLLVRGESDRLFKKARLRPLVETLMRLRGGLRFRFSLTETVIEIIVLGDFDSSNQFGRKYDMLRLPEFLSNLETLRKFDSLIKK